MIEVHWMQLLRLYFLGVWVGWIVRDIWEGRKQ